MIKSGAFYLLAALACVSLAVNAALWIDRKELVEEAENLRESVKMLHAARTGDEHARSLRDNLSEEARCGAAQKKKELDQIEAGSDELDADAFLDALLRLFSDDANHCPDTAGKPAGADPRAGNSGGDYAKP